MREVTTDTFAAARADGACTIDVREPHEYVAGHVPGARLVPLADVPRRLAEIPRKGRAYVICGTGNRSLQVTAELVAAGYDAWSVRGGTSGWERTGRPLVRSPRSNVA
jgi:rhodanese-related sulfurtransferase